MTRNCQLLGLSLRDFQKLRQQVGTENCLTWLMRNVCRNVSRFVLQILLEWLCSHSFPCYHHTIFFSEFVIPYSLQLSWNFSTTNNICSFWHTKFQEVSTHAFCSWDVIFTQKWNCSSPNNLCKCTESPFTLSTNISVERNLYFSWSFCKRELS